MTNPYFERPSSVTAGTTIRSDKYNSDLDVQESAFNALHDKLQHAVFLPETFSGNPNIPEQTVNDTFIYIDTSGNIALYPIATILEQFEEVEQRYNQINSWQQQVVGNALNAQESASLSQRFANEAENVEVVSGLYSARHWAKHAEAQIPLIEASGQAKVDAAQEFAGTASAKASEASAYADSAEDAAQLADNFANYTHNSAIPSTGGKYSAYHWAKEAEAYAQQTLSTVNGDFVPSARTVSGKALSDNIVINVADIPDAAAVAATGSYDDLVDVPVDLLREGNYGFGGFPQNLNSSVDFPDLDKKTTFIGWPSSSSAPASAPLPNGSVGVRMSTLTTRYADFVVAVQGAAARAFIQATDGNATSDWVEFFTSGNSVNPLDFGLGSNVGKLVSDLNDINASGFYRITSSGANRPPQSPTSAFEVIHAQYNADSAKQLAFVAGTGLVKFYIRTKAASNWNSWYEVYHSGNLNLSDVATSGDYDDLSNKPTAQSLGAVETSRQVNGKALTSNINLTANDVGALPSTEKATKTQRVSGSFTATRLAGITEYTSVAITNSTCTIDDTPFAVGEKLKIKKQYQSGRLDIVAAIPIYIPNGVSDTTHYVPDGYACTIELEFTGSAIELRVS